MAELSAEAAPSESVAAQALSSAARARATADADLARKAVELVPDEMLNLRADVLVELAEVSQGGGDQQSAKDAVEEAVALYERKGNLASISVDQRVYSSRPAPIRRSSRGAASSWRGSRRCSWRSCA